MAARLPVHKPRFFPPLPPTLVPLSETAIDPILEKALHTLEMSSDIVRGMLPPLKDLWEEFRKEIKHIERDAKTKRMTEKAREQARKELSVIVGLVERLSKAMAYHSELTDQMTRLRIYMAGGPDHRQELEIIEVAGKGEMELVEMMVKAAAQSGKLCAACTRKALGGPTNGSGA